MGIRRYQRKIRLIKNTILSFQAGSFNQENLVKGNCDIDNMGIPGGTDASAIVVPSGALVGATAVPVESDPAGKCECISTEKFSFGCQVAGIRKKFLAIELIPVPTTVASWWAPGPPPGGASYTIISRTISVTVKGYTSNNPP